jgi:hypothetical protein
MVECSAGLLMMPRHLRVFIWSFSIALLATAKPSGAQQPPPPAAQTQPKPEAFLAISQEGDYVAHDFLFKSGETLPELRVRYHTLGAPWQDASGHGTHSHPELWQGYLKQWLEESTK